MAKRDAARKPLLILIVAFIAIIAFVADYGFKRFTEQRGVASLSTPPSSLRFSGIALDDQQRQSVIKNLRAALASKFQRTLETPAATLNYLAFISLSRPTSTALVARGQGGSRHEHDRGQGHFPALVRPGNAAQ
jgi:hypothetical protein